MIRIYFLLFLLGTITLSPAFGMQFNDIFRWYTGSRSPAAPAAGMRRAHVPQDDKDAAIHRCGQMQEMYKRLAQDEKLQESRFGTELTLLRDVIERLASLSAAITTDNHEAAERIIQVLAALAPRCEIECVFGTYGDPVRTIGPHCLPGIKEAAKRCGAVERGARGPAALATFYPTQRPLCVRADAFTPQIMRPCPPMMMGRVAHPAPIPQRMQQPQGMPHMMMRPCPPMMMGPVAHAAPIPQRIPPVMDAPAGMPLLPPMAVQPAAPSPADDLPLDPQQYLALAQKCSERAAIELEMKHITCSTNLTTLGNLCITAVSLLQKGQMPHTLLINIATTKKALGV